MVVWISLGVFVASAPGQSQQAPVVPGGRTRSPAAPGTAVRGARQPSDQQIAGSITGTVTDPSGGAVAGARVTLAREGQSSVQEALSAGDGQFTFANLAPGPFELTITAASFRKQTASGVLHAGESYTLPPVVLAVAPLVTAIKVTPPRAEMAKFQMEEEEKQRVLHVVPNFYVSYFHDTVPLDSKQKFQLAWKSTFDPVIFGLTGAIAGVEQGLNSYSGFGQGGQGYAKRYGAAYADLAIGTFVGSAVLPSLLKQDPRYFYKGTGSRRSRFFYALANSVICKGDNGRWQPNYSNVFGNLAAGAISNLYYPEQSRTGVGLTFKNGLIGVGASAVANLLQEFVIPRFTPNRPGRSASP
jgi:Carboxypeptidase regulatory-like domain